MQDIFKTLKKCEENLLKQLTDTGTPVPDHHEWPWRNFVFESNITFSEFHSAQKLKHCRQQNGQMKTESKSKLWLRA